MLNKLCHQKLYSRDNFADLHLVVRDTGSSNFVFYIWLVSTLVDPQTRKMWSNSSISSLLASQQILSAVSLIQTPYSTTSAFTVPLIQYLMTDASTWPKSFIDWLNSQNISAGTVQLSALQGNPYWTLDWFDTDDHTPVTDSHAMAYQSSCAIAYQNSYLEWFSTAFMKGVISHAISTECWTTAGTQTVSPSNTVCVPVDIWSNADWFHYKATSPCCHFCTFTVGDVQVYHWPLATNTPSITRLVNSDNFTL
jgi:hypothetical protein